MDVNTIEYTAPGKIILFGEHAVVYKHPAIAAAINLRAKCSIYAKSKLPSILSVPDLFPQKSFELDYSDFPAEISALKFIIDSFNKETKPEKSFKAEISSQIPPSVGLGSSAAVSVSLIASLTEFFDTKLNLNNIRELAHESEKITHGFPSGIDTAVSTYGGGIIFNEGKIERIPIKLSSAHLVVINSLIARNTKDLVEKVRNLHIQDSDFVEGIFNDINGIVEDAKVALKKKDLNKIGELMSLNQILLNKLGVSHKIINEIIEILEKNKALGSKLTGAGGGGCVISIFDDYNKARNILDIMNEKGFRAFISNFSKEGVKNEY